MLTSLRSHDPMLQAAPLLRKLLTLSLARLSDAQYTVAQDEKRGSASRAKTKKLSVVFVCFLLKNSKIENLCLF